MNKRYAEHEFGEQILEDMKLAKAAPSAAVAERPPLLSDARTKQIKDILVGDCKMTGPEALDHIDTINGCVGRYNADPQTILQEIVEGAKVSDQVKQTAGQAIFDTINEALGERNKAAAPAVQASTPQTSAPKSRATTPGLG